MFKVSVGSLLLWRKWVRQCSWVFCFALPISSLPSSCVKPMASVADVCSEMADVQVMLRSDSYAEAVKRKLVTGLATKIVGMKDVDVSAAHQIMTCIKYMSICPELSEVLEKAINDRLLKTPGPKAKSAQQLLSNGLSFLTQRDWVKIDDP